MTTSEEYSTPQTKDKKKARIPSILLSRDFYTKPRNRKFIKDFGSEAIIILQVVWIASSQETSCKIRKDEAASLPYPLPFEDETITKVLEAAVAVGLLDADAEHYFNSQIVEDSDKYREKSENYSKGRQKRDEILPEFSENPPRILTKTSENHIVYVYDHDTGSGDPRKIATPPGAIKLSEKIYLDPVKYDAAGLEFLKFDLNPEFWLKRAAVHVEGWLAKPENRACDTPEQWYYHLVKWGIQQCVKERGEKIRTDNAKAVQKKINPPDNRPKSKSVHEVMAAQGIPTKGAA